MKQRELEPAIPGHGPAVRDCVAHRPLSRAEVKVALTGMPIGAVTPSFHVDLMPAPTRPAGETR